MSSRLCPFCMRMAEEEICPHCGKKVNYPGQPMHLPAGFVISGKHPYVLGAALGQGGFGITYIALDMVTNQRVAIKEYYPTYCSARTNQSAVTAYSSQEDVYLKGKERFLDEARTLKSLSDLPNIVNVLDFFESNNSAYLVMEFLEGSSLKEFAARHGKFPAQEFLQQIRPLMEDIQRMHERGVIHRDIAPDNIILMPSGQMKLIDFGSARSYLGDKSMTVVVKKGFAPLEQYMSKGATASTDVYALAATIYYCITGTVPADSAERQCDETPLVSPTDLGADLTAAQEQALTKALEIQQKVRIQTVQELLTALCVTVASTDDKEQAAPENISAVNKPMHGNTEKTPSKKANVKKIPAKKMLAGVLLLVLLAGSLFLTLTGNTRKYNRACNNLSKGEFEKASLLFEELGTYKDSQDLRNQALYSQAEMLLANGQYEEASQLFLDLGEHGDSKDKWEQTIYAWAENLFNNKQSAEALEMLQKIPHYSKTTELADEIHYQNGLSYQKSNRYLDAYKELSQVSAGHKKAADSLSKLKKDWAKDIISNAKWTEAEDFVRNVTLTEQESAYVYDCIISKDFYLSNGQTTTLSDFRTRNDMLNALVGDFPLKESLAKLFTEFKTTNSDAFIAENYDLISELWNIPVVQNIITHDWNLNVWLLGLWKANTGKYIKFSYTDEAKDTIRCAFTLPWVSEPKGTTGYSMVNQVLIWTNDKGEELAKVYRFKLLTPDSLEIYCYKNDTTYKLTRRR